MFAVLALLIAPRALTLDDAVAIAARKNPQALVAVAEAARAETVNHQALSLFQPVVEGRTTFQWNDKRIVFDPLNTGNGPVLQPHWTLNYQLSASENLALYGPALPLLRQARATTRAAAALSSEAKLEAGFAAARAYYAALEADSLAQVAQDSRAGAAELLRQTTGRREAGRATEAEVLRAKLRVAESDGALASAKRAAEEAHESLVDVLGEPGPFVLSRPPRPASPQEIDEPVSLARRPDVGAAREAIAGADDARKAAARQYYPTLTVTGLYSGYTTSDGTLFGQDRTRYTLLGVATIPIYDGNLKYWQLREKRELVRETTARADAATAIASADLRRTHRRIAGAREAEQLSKERLALAERARELVSGQYQLGAATQLELLDSDGALSAARRDASQAELEADVAVLDLRRAMGLPLIEARP